MRKPLLIALGLTSLAAFAGVASAEQPRNCAYETTHCEADALSNDRNGLWLHACVAKEQQCIKNNKGMGYDQFGAPIIWYQNSEAGGSKPKPGAHRTADGGIIMVTPEGKEWVWNGKYSPPVVTINREGYQVVITVKQGDPDVTQTRYVNGQLYNIADPKYADAIYAEQAGKSGSKGGAKGGTKVGFHPPAAPIAGGVTTSGTPGQPAPVAGPGAVATASGSNASLQSSVTRPKQNAINGALNPAGSFNGGKAKLQ